MSGGGFGAASIRNTAGLDTFTEILGQAGKAVREEIGGTHFGMYSS